MIREIDLPLPGAVLAGKEARAVMNIWRACFGGEEDARRLLENCAAGRLLLYEDAAAGTAAAMLFLLPLALYAGGRPAEQGQYVYAAGTLPAFRGRGIMAELVRSAVRASAGFTALLPAQDSLYGYYARLGFSPVLFQHRLALSRAELAREAQGAALPRVASPSPAELLARRRANCPDALLWGEEMLPYVLDDFRHSGGEVLLTGTDYAFCLPEGENLTVCECSLRDRRGLAALLLARYAGCARYELRFPGRADGAARARYGMVCAAPGSRLPGGTYFSLGME